MSADAIETTVVGRSLSPSADAWRRLRRNPLAMLCGLYIVGLIFVALFANVLAPYDYAFQDSRRYSSLPAPPDARHLLGVDDLGRDVLGRLLHGARISLTVSLVVVVIEALI